MDIPAATLQVLILKQKLGAMLSTAEPESSYIMGCQRCVSCGQARTWGQQSLEGVACSQDWPGSIQTPSLYFLLGARRLQYQLSHLPRDGPVWRETDFPLSSAMLRRRQAAGLAVMVPATFTNIGAGDVLTYAGSVSIPLPALLSRGTTFAKRNSSSCSSAVSSRGSSCRSTSGGRSSRLGSRLPRRLGTSCACLDSLSSASAVTRDTPPPGGLYRSQTDGSPSCSEPSCVDAATPHAQQVKRSRSTTSLAATAAPSSGEPQVAHGGAKSSALGPYQRTWQGPSLVAVKPATQAGQGGFQSSSSARGAMQGCMGAHAYPLRPPPPPPRRTKQAQLRAPSVVPPPHPRPRYAPHRQQSQQQQQRPKLLAGLQVWQPPQQAVTADERCPVQPLPYQQLHQRTRGSSCCTGQLEGQHAAVEVGSPEGGTAAPLTQPGWEWQGDSLAAGGKRKVMVSCY